MVGAGLLRSLRLFSRDSVCPKKIKAKKGGESPENVAQQPGPCGGALKFGAGGFRRLVNTRPTIPCARAAVGMGTAPGWGQGWGL